jgi:hypothetical protein
MKKEQVLVRDKKGLFLKMFKRKFKSEFDFFEDELAQIEENNEIDPNRCICVVYDKFELIEYLKMNKKGVDVLVCLFDKHLYSSLSFLQEIKNLILLDDSKTRTELVQELKTYFYGSSKVEEKQKSLDLTKVPIFNTLLQEQYKALFFLM